MSGHERDHRVHRHGLAPLPADASGEQREARIAELRQLRRTRRRTLALRGGIATLAMAAGVALLLYWLLMTIGGRDLLLRELVARLPAGTELTWDTAEGPASGPMVLRGVHFITVMGFSHRRHGGIGLNSHLALGTFRQQHRHNIFRRIITKQLPQLFVMVSNLIIFNQLNKCAAGVTRQRAFTKMRIL